MRKTIFAIIAAFFFIFNCSCQTMITYKNNPQLDIVKSGWKGNISINGRFYNDTLARTPSMGAAFKYKWSKNPQREEKKNEEYRLPVCHFKKLSDGNGITWLGHSTFIIQTGGVSLICDPVFYSIISTRRKTELPCNPDSLVNLDYLLISHNHFDHFDKKSVELLTANNPGLQLMAPLNVRRIFREKSLKNISLQEAGWYQEYETDGKIRIIFLPARHWGRRGLFDTNKTLWGSFLIISGNTKIFFAGDSAYDEEIYREIHDLFGDIDICLLPIGAYSPEWFMSQSHMNPEEAVQAFHDLGGKHFIPMHYGTFDLSDEPMGEPIKRLRECFSNSSSPGQLHELTIGEKWPLLE